MLVLEKPHQLLLNNLIVVCTEWLCKTLELCDSILNEDLSRGVLHQVCHRQQVSHCHLVYLVRLGTLYYLILHPHEHQVEKLPHGGSIELHYWTMCEFFKYLTCRDHRIHLLSSEQFLHELLGEHGFDNILEDLLGAFISYFLGPQSLVQDVDHLSAQVEDDKGQHVHVCTRHFY